MTIGTTSPTHVYWWWDSASTSNSFAQDGWISNGLGIHFATGNGTTSCNPHSWCLFYEYFVTGNPFCPFNSNGCGNDFDMTGFGWKNTDAISYSVQVFPSVSDFSFSFNDPSRSESIGWKGCGTYESGRFNSPLGELQEGTTSTGLGSQEMALESLYAQVDNSTLQQKAYAAAFAYSSSGIAGAKTFFESTNLVDQGFAYGTHYAAGHRFWSSTATSGLLNFGANLC